MILLSSFVFGLVFGSFLNVVIYRLKNGRNAIFGRSFCPDCKITLKWYDLIPLFSFIWLRGRCRYCGGKISWQYPIVEILSGLIWVMVAYKINFQFFPTFQSGSSISQPNFGNLGEIGTIFNFFYYIFIFSSILIIAVYDFKWRIIPDKIVYPAIIIVFLYNIFNAYKFYEINVGNRVSNIFKYLNIEMFLWPLLIAVIAFLFFFAIYFFSHGRAMGLGDAKLAFLIGLFLNSYSAALAFILAFIIGAVFGIILVGLGKIFSHYGKWGMKSQIAFGPFLMLGAFIAFFFSGFIIKLLNF